MRLITLAYVGFIMTMAALEYSIVGTWLGPLRIFAIAAVTVLLGYLISSRMRRSPPWRFK